VIYLFNNMDRCSQYFSKNDKRSEFLTVHIKNKATVDTYYLGEYWELSTIQAIMAIENWPSTEKWVVGNKEIWLPTARRKNAEFRNPNVPIKEWRVLGIDWPVRTAEWHLSLVGVYCVLCLRACNVLFQKHNNMFEIDID